MTETLTAHHQSPTAGASDVVTRFFGAYRDHDVEAMVALCAETASLEYVPFELWGRQRVLRGAGTVATVGKPLWVGLIQAFPDLSNTVRSVTADGHGNVAAEVVIGGTQARPWGTIGNQGRSFSEPHAFVFHVTDGLIDHIAAYWDGAGIARQLGHLEVD
ncbi:nuclear transport factor 2 family protein [Pseudonocardia endophytica]|uniref:Steroid delta-isomerase-like uncharacterized protein n=1 Tax=Pseudonocardia endophytica TaxID=401976 RepID=A0A4R1I4V2_PSEEN|nr:nuclear transport factor 2 family protein [Pseudonocardia endophytica]TCK27619.1 steroid delta-isomerase-like uncharacterized protein [Pseudonocardia endophytica]